MKTFFGTKEIMALEMTRQEYNDYRGWDLPADEDGTDKGYLVEYVDGGASNHPDHEGYISWSPSGVFNAAYQPEGALSFGHALVALKSGHKVARAGWNGKGMWLRLIDPYQTTSQFCVTELPDLDGTLAATVYMKTADNSLIAWLASQTDMLADDWCIVKGGEA